MLRSSSGSEAPRLYLVLYDIAEPRRWRKAHRLLKAHGAWAQLSAFFVRLPARRMARLQRELAMILDPAADRLLVCDLGDAGQAVARVSALGPHGFGAAALPQPPRPLILL